jgi:hypothetical protein
MDLVHGSSRLSHCASPLDRLISMKPFMIIAAAWPLLCSPALAQVGMIADTPALGLTSPLGGGPGAPVGATGIPMGSTEITSAGVSPLPFSSVANGTACSTVGTSPSGMFGSTATFDGGGTTPTTIAMPGTPVMSGMSTSSGALDTSGLSGMCGSGSNITAASSTPTSTPIAPGGVARTGIPMGSTEIGNLGVSSAAAVPTLSVSAFAGIAGNPVPLVPTVPLVTSPPTMPSTTTNAFACPTTGLPKTLNTPSGC